MGDMEMMIGELVRVSEEMVDNLGARDAVGLIIDKEPTWFPDEEGVPHDDQHVYTVLWATPHIPVRIYSGDVEVIL